MDIFLDGKAIQVQHAPVRTVGDLVQHLCNLPEFEYRYVEMVTVDGLELHDWQGNSGVELPKNAQIHVTSQSLAELIGAALQSAKEYLPRLDAGGVRAATLLQEGRESEAFELVGQLVEGLEWYSEFLGKVGQLLPQEERRASGRLTALGAVMDQMLQSWEGRDHTLLADLLEYELSPELQKGLQFVESLAQSDAMDAGKDP